MEASEITLPEPMPFGQAEYEQMVRERAYELYLERQAAGIETTPEEDWADAEADLIGPVRAAYDA
jgi:hypothetical protein